MQYPTLTNIQQVRNAILGREEFIEAQREGYTVFNYMVAHADSFDCPIRRECRGLIFDKNGKVLSRRFHKFFNMGEKVETFPANIDWTQPHVVLDKLDGSMITPLMLDKGDGEYDLRWATKMGVTDIGVMAEKFVAFNREYIKFAIDMYKAGKTPIFEYVGPHNRIVLPYKEENLILLAVRDNETGVYAVPDYLNAVGRSYDIPVVQPYKGSLDQLANETDIEGVVVRFNDGHMIKVKTEWYCAIHKAKENILFEKNVLKFILEDKLDDIIPHLEGEDRERLERYQRDVVSCVDNLEAYVDQVLARCEAQSIDRKEFATKHACKMGKLEATLVYSCWDGSRPIRQEVIKILLKNTKSQNSVDAIRDYLPAPWVPVGVMEDA